MMRLTGYASIIKYSNINLLQTILRVHIAGNTVLLNFVNAVLLPVKEYFFYNVEAAVSST